MEKITPAGYREPPKFTHKLAHLHRPWLAHPSTHASPPACRLVPKVAASKKCRPPPPKLPPRTLSEWPKFAQKLPQTHQPRLVYSTNNARIALCRLASKVAKFDLHPKKICRRAKTAPTHPQRVTKIRAETTPDAPTAPRLLHQ